VCGYCVRNSLFIVLVLFFGTLSAQTKKTANPNKAAKAVVVSEEAYVLKEPDFDAEVITVLDGGPKVYFVSGGKWGPFHKIRVSPTSFGYILDTDIKIVGAEGSALPGNPKEEEEEREARQRRPFLNTRYLGPVIQLTNFTEDTMADIRSQSLPFLGAKWTGYNTFFSGEMYVDSNFLFYSGAPAYYRDATGNAASGYIIIADFLLESADPQSPDTLSFYGMGPMLRLTHIEASLTQNGIKSGYIMEDLYLGVVFNAGLAARLGKCALRLDAKYYWERQKYWALGLAFQWDF
jgi:hypothetical protein